MKACRKGSHQYCGLIIGWKSEDSIHEKITTILHFGYMWFDEHFTFNFQRLFFGLDVLDVQCWPDKSYMLVFCFSNRNLHIELLHATTSSCKFSVQNWIFRLSKVVFNILRIFIVVHMTFSNDWLIFSHSFILYNIKE